MVIMVIEVNEDRNSRVLLLFVCTLMMMVEVLVFVFDLKEEEGNKQRYQSGSSLSVS